MSEQDEGFEQGDLFQGFVDPGKPRVPKWGEPPPTVPAGAEGNRSRSPARKNSSPSKSAASPKAPRVPHPEAGRGRHTPLAERLRPETIDDLTGLESVVGPGTLLRRLVEQRQPLSLIFWGPPGSGKTTLARILMTSWDLPHRQLSAVTSGIADARAVFSDASETLRSSGQPTVVFVDEIHRFNKTQQDAFLPYVENGTIILLGATTENPSFSVVSPLLSRCRVLTLPALDPEQLRGLLERAVHDRERGLGTRELQLDDGAYEALVWGSGGDARRALNALEAAAAGASDGRITGDLVHQALGSRMQQYERQGETYFNMISALHKSLRGSDPDAAVYWLVRLIEAGEDPLVAARRMVAMAAEDVGMADPRALQVAVAAFQAFQVMGSPEGDLALTEAAIYLATAPKSNAAATALWKAREAVAQHGSLPVPLHLRNAVTPLMKQLGYGKEYKYPHEFEGARITQQYLPDALQGTRLYEPTDRGYEGKLPRREA
jgi:putative ATPase